MMDDEKLPPIHPGEILNEEFLLPLDLSPHELAKSLGKDAQRIHAIIRGEESVTAEDGVASIEIFWHIRPALDGTPISIRRGSR